MAAAEKLEGDMRLDEDMRLQGVIRRNLHVSSARQQAEERSEEGNVAIYSRLSLTERQSPATPVT